MSLKNLIEQWDNHTEILTHGFQFEKAHKEIKERIRKELLNADEMGIKSVPTNEYKKSNAFIY